MRGSRCGVGEQPQRLLGFMGMPQPATTQCAWEQCTLGKWVNDYEAQEWIVVRGELKRIHTACLARMREYQRLRAQQSGLVRVK